ncbi:hypothetical protein FHR72_001740 [Mycolicibacterium iranicum]|uniref:Uncharacterized protein n=1 Tax=Mycolicibacterium iranicum TaxID=912594 RepID=A0A839QAJ3_MYCIR|nr:hypothetical protein [Mycolicibacterium iranicum]MBB2990272.1 hypothetical protein [Mycolicibacterium iranicum]
MSKKSPRKQSRIAEFLHADLGRYDPHSCPEDQLYRDTIVSVLGAAMDGWVPELVFRLAIDHRTGLNIDWAIMTHAYRIEDGAKGDRRRVERIDICESEVHYHRFRRSDDPDDDQGERRRIISLYADDAVEDTIVAHDKHRALTIGMMVDTIYRNRGGDYSDLPVWGRRRSFIAEASTAEVERELALS